MKKLKMRVKKAQWNISIWWYTVKRFFGWWFCWHCEKMHSPFTAKYEFNDSGEQECHKGVYDLQVPKSYESDPEYFYMLAKDLHRVG